MFDRLFDVQFKKVEGRFLIFIFHTVTVFEVIMVKKLVGFLTIV